MGFPTGVGGMREGVRLRSWMAWMGRNGRAGQGRAGMRWERQMHIPPLLSIVDDEDAL